MKNILNKRALSYQSLYGRPRYVCDWVAADGIDGKTFLNVGCGFGWFEKFLVEHHKPGRVVGIEQTDEDLASARASLAGTQVELQVASGLATPFGDGAFDTIVCTEVIEHIPRGTEQALLNETYRLLKPGGKAFLTTPARTLLSTAFDPAWYFGHRHYTCKEIFRFAKGSGLSVRDCNLRGGGGC